MPFVNNEAQKVNHINWTTLTSQVVGCSKLGVSYWTTWYFPNQSTLKPPFCNIEVSNIFKYVPIKTKMLGITPNSTLPPTHRFVTMTKPKGLREWTFSCSWIGRDYHNMVWNENAIFYLTGENASCMDHIIYNFGGGKNMCNMPQFLLCIRLYNWSLELRIQHKDWLGTL